MVLPRLLFMFLTTVSLISGAPVQKPKINAQLVHSKASSEFFSVNNASSVLEGELKSLMVLNKLDDSISTQDKNDEYALIIPRHLLNERTMNGLGLKDYVKHSKKLKLSNRDFDSNLEILIPEKTRPFFVFNTTDELIIPTEKTRIEYSKFIDHSIPFELPEFSEFSEFCLVMNAPNDLDINTLHEEILLVPKHMVPLYKQSLDENVPLLTFIFNTGNNAYNAKEHNLPLLKIKNYMGSQNLNQFFDVFAKEWIQSVGYNQLIHSIFCTVNVRSSSTSYCIKIRDDMNNLVLFPAYNGLKKDNSHVKRDRITEGFTHRMPDQVVHLPYTLPGDILLLHLEPLQTAAQPKQSSWPVDWLQSILRIGADQVGPICQLPWSSNPHSQSFLHIDPEQIVRSLPYPNPGDSINLPQLLKRDGHTGTDGGSSKNPLTQKTQSKDSKFQELILPLSIIQNNDVESSIGSDTFSPRSRKYSQIVASSKSLKQRLGPRDANAESAADVIVNSKKHKKNPYEYTNEKLEDLSEKLSHRLKIKNAKKKIKENANTFVVSKSSRNDQRETDKNGKRIKKFIKTKTKDESEPELDVKKSKIDATKFIDKQPVQQESPKDVKPQEPDCLPITWVNVFHQSLYGNQKFCGVN